MYTYDIRLILSFCDYWYSHNPYKYCITVSHNLSKWKKVKVECSVSNGIYHSSPQDSENKGKKGQ